MTATLATTPLHEWHASHGGRLVPFAGWSMPVQYTSVVAEHNATRTAAGLFDISHMGRIRFDGPAAESFLDRLVTRRISGLGLGKIRYALVTNDAGGILDDVLVYHLQDRTAGRPYYLLVVNASNREKILEWIDRRRDTATDLEYRDLTEATAMIAVQGPRAIELLRPLTSLNLEGLKYYSGQEADVAGAPAIVSRTGYTGEDGWELIVPADNAVAVWGALMRNAPACGALPAGLGARDTLRLEAAMPLYGHELTESIDPFQAGLDFAVDLDDHVFPGRDALARLRQDKRRPQRIGLELSSRRIPRENYPVLSGDQKIGYVTSGTFSPTLEKPIAMAYVPREYAKPGTELIVDIRGARQPARVVELAFYRRPSNAHRTGTKDP